MRFFEAASIKVLVSLVCALSSHGLAPQCFATGLSATATSDLRWKKRLLFVNADTQYSRSVLRVWQAEHGSALKERKLLILQHELDELWTVTHPQQSMVYSNRRIADSICTNCFVLVGLDGSVKYRKTLDADNLDKLFDLIDAMPMRQSELVSKR